MKIYLDDVRNPYDDSWTLTRNVDEFKMVINGCETDFITAISFDHDLGIDNNGIMLDTGFDAAKWLIEIAQDDPKRIEDLETIIVHSSNPPGADNIRGLFISAQRFGIIKENVEIR